MLGQEPSPEFAAGVAEEYGRLLGLLRDDNLQTVAVRKMEGKKTRSGLETVAPRYAELGFQDHFEPLLRRRGYEKVSIGWPNVKASPANYCPAKPKQIGAPPNISALSQNSVFLANPRWPVEVRVRVCV